MKNNILKAIMVCLGSVPLLFAGCSKNPEEGLPKDPVQIDLSATQMALVESGNSFAFDIFRKIMDNADASENIIFSPLSISYALSMTLNGANGATREAMLEALRTNGITPEEINSSFSKLTDALLTVDKRVLMTIANSVWTEKNFCRKKIIHRHTDKFL